MRRAILPFLMGMTMSLLAVPAALAAQAPAGPDGARATRGARSFRVYCGSCHGREARGDGPLAKDLRVKPANLTELSKRNDGEFPFEMVVDTIDHGRSVRAHGTEDMPAWGDAFEMTEQTEEAAKAKMEDLAHYLWSIQASP